MADIEEHRHHFRALDQIKLPESEEPKQNLVEPVEAPEPEEKEPEHEKHKKKAKHHHKSE